LPQFYRGAINTVGLDAGVTDGGVLAWTVYGRPACLPAGALVITSVPAGALAGEYVGVSGDIGLIVSTGANILIGGSGCTFALLSSQGSIAFNIVLGVSMLKLRVG
jgi:hypothetical protein